MAPRAFQSSADYRPTPVTERRGFEKIFPEATPKGELGKYRILSSHAGVRVSPLCLGTMNLGNQWTGYMGKAVDYGDSEKLLDTFYGAGGNFIDTANVYQDEQSEVIIGEWMEKRGNRDEIVLATKYTMLSVDRKDDRFENNGLSINHVGNSRKNLRISVDRSLKNLKTHYIDLLYIHFWDYTTSVAEVMRSLDDLVKSGKVLYLGISDTPAWIVAQANDYANTHGLTPFSIYQGRWNLALRDLEREVIPMCRAYGMAVAAWGVLGQGMFKTAAELQKRAENLRDASEPSEKEMAIVSALEEVSNEIGNVGLTTVALAWARQMVFDCFPVIGGSSVDRLQENIEALKVKLSEEQMSRLSNAIPFDWGFPYDSFGRDPSDLPGGIPENRQTTTGGRIEFKRRI